MFTYKHFIEINLTSEFKDAFLNTTVSIKSDKIDFFVEIGISVVISVCIGIWCIGV